MKDEVMNLIMSELIAQILKDQATHKFTLPQLIQHMTNMKRFLDDPALFEQMQKIVGKANKNLN